MNGLRLFITVFCLAEGSFFGFKCCCLDFGLADAYVLATAKRLNAKVLTWRFTLQEHQERCDDRIIFEQHGLRLQRL
jgi:hypothetical protein